MISNFYLVHDCSGQSNRKATHCLHIMYHTVKWDAVSQKWWYAINDKPPADCCTTCFFSYDGNALRLISGDDCTTGNVARSPKTTAARRQTCLIRGPRSWRAASAVLTLLSPGSPRGISPELFDGCLLGENLDFNWAMQDPESCNIPPTIGTPQNKYASFSNTRYMYRKKLMKLKCGPMPNVMAALPNVDPECQLLLQVTR